MRHRSHMSSEERSVRSRLARLVHEDSILCGSLVTMRNTCGKPGCKCAQGERHISLCLSIRTEQGRKMIHIPKSMEEEVTAWVRNYEDTKGWINEISQSCLKRLLKEKSERR